MISEEQRKKDVNKFFKETFNVDLEILSSEKFSDCLLFIACEKNGATQLLTNAKSSDFTLIDKEYRIIPL